MLVSWRAASTLWAPVDINITRIINNKSMTFGLQFKYLYLCRKCPFGDVLINICLINHSLAKAKNSYLNMLKVKFKHSDNSISKSDFKCNLKVGKSKWVELQCLNLPRFCLENAILRAESCNKMDYPLD